MAGRPTEGPTHQLFCFFVCLSDCTQVLKPAIRTSINPEGLEKTEMLQILCGKRELRGTFYRTTCKFREKIQRRAYLKVFQGKLYHAFSGNSNPAKSACHDLASQKWYIFYLFW